MQKRFVVLLFILAIFPLNADTELQRQAENAQNYLEWTISRIAHSWGKMKYHFVKGNEALKDSAGVNNESVQKKIKKFQKN